MGNVVGGVPVVRQYQVADRRWRCLRLDQPRQVGRAGRVGQAGAAERGKRQVGFAADHVIGELADRLLLGLVADFRPAHDDDQVRLQPFQVGYQLGRDPHIPDIHPEPDDPRTVTQDLLGQVNSALADLELEQLRARRQVAEVGQQVSQPERRMRVPRVAGGQDDIRRARFRLPRHAMIHPAGSFSPRRRSAICPGVPPPPTGSRTRVGRCWF